MPASGFAGGAERAVTALALHTEAARRGGTVDAAPSRDLVRGLLAAGYPLDWVEDRLGQPAPLWAARVPRDLAGRLARLADWCAANYPGPCQLSMELARARGWSVDLLWADLDDEPPDPGYVDWVAVRRAVYGAGHGDTYARLSAAELRAAAELGGADYPASRLAERAHANDALVRRISAQVHGRGSVPLRDGSPLPPLRPDPKWHRPAAGRRPAHPYGNAPVGYCRGCGEETGVRRRDGTRDLRAQWHSDCAEAGRSQTAATDRAPTRAQARAAAARSVAARAAAKPGAKKPSRLR
jgi:hypothetical protein